MTQLSLNLPIIGNTNAQEDPKVRTALSDIQTVVNALDNSNIAGGANINGSKIASATIAAAQLASDSVETAKIVDDAVTADKLKDDASTDANRAVTTNHIRNLAVTTDKIADTAVTTAKIAAAAVTANEIRNGEITNSKIADDAVSPSKLNLTVSSDSNSSETNYVGTSQTTITGLELSITAGVYLLIANLNINTNNNLQCKAQLWNSTNSLVIGQEMYFEGEGRSAYSVPVNLLAVYTASGNQEIGVRVGSGAGSSVDITVPADDQTLTALRIG